MLIQNNDKKRQQDWIITDVVMYSATNNTILTFFHSHEEIAIGKLHYAVYIEH